MQINNLFLGTQLQLNEGPSLVRAGDVFQAVIKDRSDQNKVTLTIKGQEVPVKFEGEIPANDRVTLEVVRIDEKGQLVVKPVEQEATPSNSQQDGKVMKAGSELALSNEVREAVQYMSSKGYRLSKEDVAALQKFMKNEKGSLEEKMATIQALVQRKLELTSTHLASIHSALHGESATSLLLNYLDGLSISMEQEVELQMPTDKKVNQQVTANEKESKSTDKIESTQQIRVNEAGQGIDMAAEEIDATLDDVTDKLTQSEKMIVANAVQSLNLDSKTVIVTEITAKLSQLTMDFKKAKQEVMNFLEHLTKDHRIQAPQARQFLESSISKLDNAILKGNYMLYADMSTEKELLSASSQLARAKDLVMKGSYPEAQQIVKEVHALLERVNFKPSNTKMMHFVSEQSLIQKEGNPSKQLINELQQLTKPLPQQDYSARQVYETVKRLGISHENQLAHFLTRSTKGEMEPNIKSILLKMVQLENGVKDGAQPLNQALTNLTGQQLLNKPDSSGMQNTFMQFPVMVEHQNEQVKVFINAKKKGKGIDWENCQLYFVLETKKLGEIGVSVKATNRNLSITLKNNNEQFIRKAELLKEDAAERLNEIGYKVAAIHFKPFAEKSKESMNEEIVTPQEASDERGYDVKI
ncbi:hypothetical protein J2Z40_002576 [Cytobacillus eiseniae]|uniref:Flagellar hook-length control protein-like C-terminal domain-containing protein n=1 Tax=Cytobacillus eiseniae TaxID=762947 RepID=A0ABS4RGW8_9BACI|nr:hypothetical protein [Cytobacillus eiseniae]MBP2242003.1 hypothetical protein [Cytobacillus eiseniae]